MDFNFRLFEPKDIDNISRFLLPRKLNYRGYDVWLQKALEELRWGVKESVLGFSDNTLVASLMFQSCKHLEGFTEVKNGRTIKELERRFFLSFMMRQVEALSKEEGRYGVICDARSDRIEIVNFLKINGYKEIARVDLYKEGYEDVVMAKALIN